MSTAVSAISPPVPLRMSADDFLSWREEGIRAEWVDGEVVTMAPANLDHADLNAWLSAVVRQFVEARSLGFVFGPEVAVRLSAERTQRVPDLLFVANERRGILRRTFVDGPPDLMLEIVSPDSESRDWRDKYLEYESAGVSEYWVLDPMSQHAEAYRRNEAGKYVRLPETDGKIASSVIAGFYLRPAWLWSSPRPQIRTVLAELQVTPPGNG